MGTIRLFLHPAKDKKSGKQAVNIVYSLHGERKFFRSKIHLFSVNWDQSSQHVPAIYVDKKIAKAKAPEIDYDKLLSAKEAAGINADLIALKKEILDLERLYEASGTVYTSEMLIQDFRKKKKTTKAAKPEKSDSLIEFIDVYTSDHATQNQRTLRHYAGLKNHLIAMKANISFADINHQFMQRFQNYLIQKKGLVNSTAAKQIDHLKAVLKYASNTGKKIDLNYKTFTKVEIPDQDIVALTNEEFNKLFEMDLSNDTALDMARDWLCFACSTGLRRSDLESLKWQNRSGDEIRITEEKTDKKHTVHINRYSDAIWKKYVGQETPLPFIARSTLNDCIKRLCERAGIDTPTKKVKSFGSETQIVVVPKYKLISIHCGRRTFASMISNAGVSLQELMAATGHSSYASVKRYIKVSEERRKNVMVSVFGAVPAGVVL
jgi:integrase